MNPKLPALLLSSVLLLNACANTGASPSSATQGNPPDARIPYPEPDTQAQIDNLGIQMARLEKQQGGEFGVHDVLAVIFSTAG